MSFPRTSPASLITDRTRHCLAINDVSRRCERIASQARCPHTPTATTTTEAACRFTIGLKAPTRLHDEPFLILRLCFGKQQLIV